MKVDVTESMEVVKKETFSLTDNESAMWDNFEELIWNLGCRAGTGKLADAVIEAFRALRVLDKFYKED